MGNSPVGLKEHKTRCGPIFLINNQEDLCEGPAINLQKMAFERKDT